MDHEHQSDDHDDGSDRDQDGERYVVGQLP